MRLRRPTVLASVASLVAGLTFGLPPIPVAAAEPPADQPIAASYLPGGSKSGAQLPQAKAVAPVWPSAGSASAALDSLATSTMTAGSVVKSEVAPGGLRVTVGTPSSGSASVEENEQRLMRGLPEQTGTASSGLTSVDVTTLDQAATQRLRVRGVVLTVAPSASAQLAASAPAEVSVDYSSFRGAYGGGYSDRLRLVSLPACALTTPDVPACQVQTPLAGGVNNKGASTVSAPVDFAPRSDASTRSAQPETMDAQSTPSSADGGAMVLAVSGGASSEQGNWGATSLSQAGNWQAGGSAGGFTYSIPVPVPPAPGGLTPKISFDYSSAAIDGLTKSTSQQSSWIGEGWNYEPGYVERSYRPCRLDGQTSNEGDLCYVAVSPVTVVLNGVSTRLFRNDSDGTWMAEDDSAGWRVERITGQGNGALDGEAFKITTRDGTQYWFGYHDHASEGGVLSVEVFGNNSGEPCNHPSGFAYSHCPQPYRWNLDRVVDIHGNVIEYKWGTFQGSYAGNNGANVWDYDVYGWLKEIQYGGNTVTGSANTGRVLFDITYRCFETEDVCAQAPYANSQHWLDTPWDLYCYPGAGSCGNHTPAFFSIYRLLRVSTYVGSPADWGTAIEDFQTTQDFPSTGDWIAPAGDDSSPSLHLWRMWRGGYGAPIEMSDIAYDNRVDYGTDKPPMMRYRIGTLSTYTGEQINVTYNGDVADSSHRDCLPWENLSLIAQDNNDRRCFPQNQGGVLSWWHKYVVTDVSTHDTTGSGAPDERWHYDYSNDGSTLGVLWKHDQAWHVPISERTWSRWAGYATVTTIYGAADGSGPQQYSESLYFQGLDGDKTLAGGWGARAVSIFDDWDYAADQPALAGRLRRTFTWNGAPDANGSNWASAVRHMHSVPTFGQYHIGGDNPDILASRPLEVETRSGTRMAGPVDRWTRVLTDFDSTYSLPTRVTDLGEDTNGGPSTDDKCTDFTYTAPNTSAWIVGLPKQMVTTNCAGSPTKNDVLAASRTYYDQSGTLGAAPSRGLVSKSMAIAAATAYPPANTDYVQQSRATHDSFGRILDAFDALERKTSTAYTPGNSGPTTSVAVTGPMGAGWTMTTTLDPRWGVPTKVVDVNGKATDAEYDSVGRLSKVWKDNRGKAVTPNVAYNYVVRDTLPSYVQTLTLGPGGQQISSYQLFDGRLRPRQTQAVSATGTGQAISETWYNGIGQAAKQSTYSATGTPGANNAALVSVADTSIAVQTRLTYDNLGRNTLVEPYTMGSARGASYNTTYGYDGDKTFTMTPPSGGTATTTIKDVRGQTVELRQHQGGTPGGAYISTTYAYDRLGHLTSVKDAALNTWTYSYDLLGRKTQTVDPDAGTSSSTYDNAGQVLSTTDGRGQQLFYTYDNLGRKTTERITSATGQIQADWVYNTTGFKGQLNSTSRYINGVATYTSRVDAYDNGYRPTQTTEVIPGFGLTNNEYTVKTTYKVNGAVDTQTFPAVAGLPGGTAGEKITHAYRAATGLPDRLTSDYNSTVYVDWTNYFYDGLLDTAVYGAASGNQVKVKATYEAATRRLLTSAFDTKTSGTWTNNRYKDTYGYDAAGNIKSIAGTKDGAVEQEQCFRYDYLRRLTEAWTQASGTCTTAQRTGADPYWRQWPSATGYDNIGNRKQQIDKDSGAGDTTWNYAIGGTDICGGAVKPHQVRQITGSGPKLGTATRDFCYDAAGNTKKRTTETGAVQDLTWDVEGHLQEVKQGAISVASYIYDTSGRRLIGTEYNISTGKTTVTAYLADGTELAKVDTANPVGRRYYGAGAVRDAVTGLKWTIDNHQASGVFQVDASTNAIGSPRRFLPFGEARNAQPTGWVGTKGYVGGTQDSTTGLTHLGAREYDPSLGRFISRDPIVDFSNSQQMHGYSYGNHSPVTFLDPAGTNPLCGNDGGAGDCSSAPSPPPAPDESTVSSNERPKKSGCYDGNKSPTCSEPDSISIVVNGLTFDGLTGSIQNTGTPCNLGVACIGDTYSLETGDPVATYEASLLVSCYFSGHCTMELIAYLIMMCACDYMPGLTPEAAGWRALDISLGHALIPQVPDGLPRGVYYAPSDGALIISLPNGETYRIPAGWTNRVARNGKGVIFQKPGPLLHPDAYMIRIMDPTNRYPDGYIRVHNKYGQPIGLDGKPGSRDTTHFPRGRGLPYPRIPL